MHLCKPGPIHKFFKFIIIFLTVIIFLGSSIILYAIICANVKEGEFTIFFVTERNFH